MDPRLEEARTRRDRIVAEIVARTGITETQIERLVGTFYARIRDDALLGPIFAARVEDWDTHLKKMCAFWSSVALMSGRYSGQPMQAHLPLPVDETHFARWLAIFEETANEVCTTAGAAHFMERARRIAESLRMGIAFHRGERI
ncbi:MAG: group III truncated hemoglobin [Alphaproteobacteria bacterium]